MKNAIIVAGIYIYTRIGGLVNNKIKGRNIILKSKLGTS
mgnify:CR=1 FL=1